jgi:P-type Ca2+ transporter type 2C
LFAIITTLSKTRHAVAILFEKNLVLLFILLSAAGLLILLITVPYLRTIFSFNYPGVNHFTTSIIGAVCVLIILEGAKYLKYRRYNVKA